MVQKLSTLADSFLTDQEVFISHRNTEISTEFARRLCDRLGEIGVSAWLDKDRLAAGTSYKKEITEAIRKARAVVCVFEQEKSDWLIVAILVPIVGLVMTAMSDGFAVFDDAWISLSIMLYVISLFLWVTGLLLFQSASSADMAQNARKFTIMSARANIVFLAAFSINVLVVNLMLFHNDFSSLLNGG